LEKVVASYFSRVNKAHNKSRVAIKKAWNAIEECRGPGWKNSSGVMTPEVSLMQTTRKIAKKRLNKCREGMVIAFQYKDDCDEVLKSVKQSKVSVCKSYKSMDTLMMNAHDACVPISVQNENQMMWTRRVLEHFRSERDKIRKEKELCNNLTSQLAVQNSTCQVHRNRYDGKVHECDSTRQREVMEAECSWKSGLQALCSTYDTCYATTVKAYSALANLTKNEVATRKSQWQTAKRMECLVAAYDFKAGKVVGKKLDKCIAKRTYRADHLNIAIQDAPAKGFCNMNPSNIQESCTTTTTTSTTVGLSALKASLSG